MTAFYNALLGGALIGLAVTGLILINGRIAGVSGILGSAFRGESGVWRWTFLAGLIAAGFFLPSTGWSVGVSAGELPGSVAILILAGFLVGLGTTIGSGCTSGHGICGIANLSFRSFVATLVFMAVAMLTVFVVRHLGG